MTPILEDLLAARPDAVAQLAAQVPSAWEALERHIADGGACPEELVHALVAVDDLDDQFDVRATGWGKRFRPTVGNPYDDRPGWGFADWLSAAIAKHLPASHVMALRVRLRALLEAPSSPDVTPAMLDLARDISLAGATPPHRVLLALVMLWLAYRFADRRDRDEACAHVQCAHDVLVELDADPTLGVAGLLKRAMGLLASEWVRQRRFDAAFALAEATWRFDVPGTRQLTLAVAPRAAPRSSDALERTAGEMAQGNWNYGGDWIEILDAFAREQHYAPAAERATKVRALNPDAAAATDDNLPGPMR